MAKINNLENDVQALEEQLRQKKKELKEEQQRIKNERNNKLKDFANDFITLVKDNSLINPPVTWDSTDGEWVHEGLLEHDIRLGGYDNPQGIYLSGFYTRKGQPTVCAVDSDDVEKVVLTIVADGYNSPEVLQLVRKLND